MKIAISVGHHPLDKGAVNVQGVSEFDFWDKAVSDIISRYIGPHELIKVHRKNPKVMPYEEINAINPDWFFECHFNSHGDPLATGTEVLFFNKSETSEAIAKIFAAHIHKSLGLALRNKGSGLLPVGLTGRGGALLGKTRMPGVLIEPFFGSNHRDVEMVRRFYNILIGHICVAIDDVCDLLQGKKKEKEETKAEVVVVPQNLIDAIVLVESGGNPYAIRFEQGFYDRYIKGKPVKTYGPCSKDTEMIARATSWGAMQVMGQVARELGYDKTYLSQLCGQDGIDIGVKYLRQLALRFSFDWKKVISAYNAGPGGVGTNPEYVSKVVEKIQGSLKGVK
jgi:hypothetical protein